MKLSLKDRRFLIVWISVNAFALFVNIAHIKGELQKKSGYWDYNNIPQWNLFTEGNGIDEDYSIFHPATFWPFTTDFTTYNIRSSNGNLYDERKGFAGIFNEYSYLEFIVYCLLGIAVVIVPKLWSVSSDNIQKSAPMDRQT